MHQSHCPTLKFLGSRRPLLVCTGVVTTLEKIDELSTDRSERLVIRMPNELKQYIY
ncbi:hypothetical protein P3T43_006740 [Paraburkholderia sp. GAS41]|jgi:hypothetical protein|uniref:hypothetical protein n=1 Tax=Paraburkholderia sp. GAS41 TaxID=3035134 RepID=UPI003D1C0C10